jgi:hypothetical protein
MQLWLDEKHFAFYHAFYTGYVILLQTAIR